MKNQNEQNEGLTFWELMTDLLFFTIKAVTIVFLCGYAGMMLAEKLLNH